MATDVGQLVDTDNFRTTASFKVRLATYAESRVQLLDHNWECDWTVGDIDWKCCVGYSFGTTPNVLVNLPTFHRHLSVHNIPVLVLALGILGKSVLHRERHCLCGVGDMAVDSVLFE